MNRRLMLALIAGGATWALSIPLDSNATNGLNQIGFGPESMGMGGADIAVARDSSALNTNPAGLSQIRGGQADFNTAIGYSGNITHQDSLGNDKQNQNSYPVLGSFGLSGQLSTLPATLGIGVFAQGGTGNEFEDMRTAFGTYDKLSATLRIARVSPGIAWKFNDTLAVGASLIGTYADLEQEVFPNTSFTHPTDPARSFYGYELTSLRDTGLGFKLGLMYKPSDRVTLGVAYNSKIDMNFEGEARVEFSALGLGKVTYRDAQVKNLDQPQELGIGLAVQATEKLLMSFEVNWIDWSDAVDGVTITARQPDNPLAPPTLQQVDPNSWRDQYVIALGLAYKWGDDTLIRLGYNYGRDPIPNESLSPLLNTITEHHVTIGVGRRLGRTWRVDGAFAWDIKNDETYYNPGLPFGPGARAIGDLYALHLGISRTW